jgi:hypothetical protein
MPRGIMSQLPVCMHPSVHGWDRWYPPWQQLGLLEGRVTHRYLGSFGVSLECRRTIFPRSAVEGEVDVAPLLFRGACGTLVGCNDGRALCASEER